MLISKHMYTPIEKQKRLSQMRPNFIEASASDIPLETRVFQLLGHGQGVLIARLVSMGDLGNI